MFFNFFFCCSNSALKENKTITFEKLNSNEENNTKNNIIPPCVNIENNHEKNSINELNNNKESINDININESSIHYNVQNINHLINNINNINVINNSYYGRERSNKVQNNIPFINTISNKSSFKSLLIKKYNNQGILNANLHSKYKNNNNLNNFQSNNNNYQKANSILSFSNLIVSKNTKTNNNDDTEILSPYELLLSGDIFFNNEIKIDRLGIKSIKIADKKKRKEHLIKFGILIKNNKDSDFHISDIKSKLEKESEGYNIKQDKNSISSSFIKGKENNNLDMVLNVEQETVIKLLDQYEQIIASENKDEDDFSSPKIRRENKTITLFTIRYISSMELFEFCSTHNSIPIELLLDHEYQLRNGYDYNVNIGEVCVILKVFKNKNDEDILRIKIKDNKGDKNGKQEECYNFNSSNEINKYISIGRINCTINVNNDTVSDTHLKIRYSDNTDTFSIIDGGSKNGSYLLLNEPFNFLYIKNILSFRLFESKFSIKFIHNCE